MSSYMVSRAGEQFGPYSEEDLRAYLGSGQVLPDDLAWTEGMENWLPVSRVFSIGAHAFNNSSALVSISESWKKRFALIERAGGPKLPRSRDLSFSERSGIVFNILGALFNGFYYLAKGMWKKAITLTGLSVVITLLLELILSAMGFSQGAKFSVVSLVVPVAIFGARANIDYYKKVILGDNGWW